MVSNRVISLPDITARSHCVHSQLPSSPSKSAGQDVEVQLHGQPPPGQLWPVYDGDEGGVQHIGHLRAEGGEGPAAAARFVVGLGKYQIVRTRSILSENSTHWSYIFQLENI